MNIKVKHLDPDSMVRSPGVTYQQLLDDDTHEVPEVLRLQSPVDLGDVDVPASRYTSREWFDKEVEHLWKKVWQYTCREEEIPEPGDLYVYDIAGMSFIVVRTESGAIKAYPNACLHRGRQLKEYDCRTSELRCAFHGFCWSLDGELKDVPARWDFPQIKDDEWTLTELPVATWKGFVFINPDPKCEPFEDFAKDIIDQFERWNLEDRYIQAHVAKIVPRELEDRAGSVLRGLPRERHAPADPDELGRHQFAGRCMGELRARDHTRWNVQPVAGRGTQ